MLRFLTAILVLLSPLASAGVSASTDVLPPATSSCEESSGYDSTSTWWYDNDSYYYSSEGVSFQERDCEGSSDLARAEIASNENEVASARVGDSASGSESDAQTWDNAGGGFSTNDSSSWWRDADSRWSEWSEFRAGREARVSTFAGAVTIFDGCEGSASSWGSSYESGNGWSSPTGSSASSRSQESSSSQESSECGRAATAQTGVTTIEAGHSDGCRRSGWSYSAAQSGSGENWSYAESSAYNATSEDCVSEASAQAGDERAAVGSRSNCDEGSFGHDSSEWSTYHAWSECDARTGVFGPDGFGVFLQDKQWSSCNGASAEECTMEGGEWRALGVEHDLVGSMFFTLP